MSTTNYLNKHQNLTLFLLSFKLIFHLNAEYIDSLWFFYIYILFLPSFNSVHIGPNSVTLSLNPFSQNINASWTLDGDRQGFNVSIEGGNYIKSDITNNMSYNFMELRAAVYYTVTVVTLSEKPDLISDSVNQSVYTSK